MAENRPPRILVVDDREQNRYILSRTLQQAGYECEQGSTGHQALEKARTLPSLIILDVHLPDASGLDICQQIKKDPVTSHIPVLQISASYISSEDKAKSLESGADSYLTHPIDSMVLIATVRSLLRLRTAESIAREASVQWQSTFDALSEALALVDPGGKFVRCNAAFAHLCGKRTHCAPGDDAFRVLRDLVGSDEPLRHTGPERYSGEYVVEGRTIRVTVDTIMVGSAETGRAMALTDVTDTKLAEYAIRTAEKLAATGKLAHAIAHEINNPLEALVNLIYLASCADRVEDMHQFLQQANTEVARISRITKQSLSFHRDTQYPVPLDVGSLVSEVVSLYGKLADTRQVRLLYEHSPTLTIHGFPGQLSQVFGNLVRNAAEAAPPGSDVNVRVRPSRRSGRDGTLVTVHDRGPGIPQDVQQLIFDPFFTTKELKGSGLGLWVSKSLVLKHQGTIRFRTSTRDCDSGTTFQVFLPIDAVSQAAMETAGN
jgi:two-component system, NtrC family, sensor kinase